MQYSLFPRTVLCHFCSASSTADAQGTRSRTACLKAFMSLCEPLLRALHVPKNWRLNCQQRAGGKDGSAHPRAGQRWGSCPCSPACAGRLFRHQIEKYIYCSTDLQFLSSFNLPDIFHWTCRPSVMNLRQLTTGLIFLAPFPLQITRRSPQGLQTIGCKLLALIDGLPPPLLSLEKCLLVCCLNQSNVPTPNNARANNGNRD